MNRRDRDRRQSVYTTLSSAKPGHRRYSRRRRLEDLRIADQATARELLRKVLNHAVTNLDYASHLTLLKWLRLEVESRIEAIGEED